MDLGLDVGHVRLHVRSALQYVDLWTSAAEQLVLGTGIHESHLKYLFQLKGPALGLFQIEPLTYIDIQKNYLRYHPGLANRVRQLAGARYADMEFPPPTELSGNIQFAAAMCRVFYLRLPDALPLPNDARGMAALWKARYNTPLGKGTLEQALPAFELACKE